MKRNRQQKAEQAAARTEGEQLFEQYLKSLDLSFEFEKQYSGKSARPDYTVNWNGIPHLFDIKDFHSPQLPMNGFGAVQGYKPIRERISRCRKKFKEYKEFCCVPVFFNSGALVFLEHSHFMLGSMYGDSGFTLPFDPSSGAFDSGKIQHEFLGGGKMRDPRGTPRNTTISALITLTSIRPDYQKLVAAVRNREKSVSECVAEAERDPTFNSEWRVPRVIVWHNVLARMPFPEDLFCGPYDSHFGILKNSNGEAIQQVTYRGSLLPVHIPY